MKDQIKIMASMFAAIVVFCVLDTISDLECEKNMAESNAKYWETEFKESNDKVEKLQKQVKQLTPKKRTSRNAK